MRQRKRNVVLIFFWANSAGKSGIGGLRRNADVAPPSSAWRENAILISSHQEYRSSLIDKRLKEVELAQEEESAPNKLPEGRGGGGMREMIKDVKTMLSSMGDGEITSSAYDTAWVAMVQDLRGSGGPQFPSCLRWIIDNQLDDSEFSYQLHMATIICLYVS